MPIFPKLLAPTAVLALFIAACGGSGGEAPQDPQDGVADHSVVKGADQNADENADRDGFQLRLLVYGLQALVPRDADFDGTYDDITILPVLMPPHEPRLSATKGVCKSGSSCHVGPNTFQLDWDLADAALAKSRLSLSPTAAPPFEKLGLKTPAAPVGVPAPAALWGWEWAGWLDHGAASATPAKKACRDQPWSAGCSAAASLTLDHADAFGACHLSHTTDEATQKDLLEVVRFQHHGDDKARAVADAFLFEIHMPGERLTVTARRQDGTETSAVIEPEGCGAAGKCVTLVFSNNDYQSFHGSGRDHQHFKHYYSLAHGGPTAQILKWVKEEEGNPGSCEDELEDFDDLACGGCGGSHDHRECDIAALNGWGP
ncbi:MAG: hypothetical protein AAGD06_30275 [Acidobacteriota bacterium]